MTMSLLRPHPRRLPILSSRRTFSTTPTLPVSLQIDRNNPEAIADIVPAYPYGPARWYKQSNKGLYGGQRIQCGNNVSGDFSTKTRRTFQVNVFTKRLWSHALGRFVQIRVSARTLRTIDRVGGLDEYLLGDSVARIKQLGVSGWWLRWAIMQQPAVKARYAKERRDLGLVKTESGELVEAETPSLGLDEAYAALYEEGKVAEEELAEEELADEELAEGTTAEHDPETEEALVMLDGSEPSSTPPSPDETFTVENPPDLPPLKFRVERGAHVVLTPFGWTRTRPGELHRKEYTKQYLASRHFPTYVDDHMALFEAEFAKKKKEMVPLSAMEEHEVMKAARRQLEKVKEEKVEALWKEKKKLYAARREARTVRKATEARKREEEAAIREEGGGGVLDGLLNIA